MRDFFQVSPEGIFKADAGLVSINDDGTFNDRGFHQGSPETPRARYRCKADSELAEVVRYRPALMCLFVMPDTAASGGMSKFLHITKGIAMDAHKQDVATLIELLKMAAERWPRSEADQVSQSELLREDHSLLEMWPEACRRTGVGRREFPPGVIKLWQERLGRAN